MYIHFAVHQKLTQYCKSIILQFKKKRKNNTQREDRERISKMLHFPSLYIPLCALIFHNEDILPE